MSETGVSREPPPLDDQRPFFVAGGTLPHDSPCYLERQADAELYACLRRGEFCYLLTARQMGKSSLMVRTAARLRREGVAVVILDLTALGQTLTIEQWYRGLLSLLGLELELEVELAAFWQAHLHLGPLQRWMGAVREVALRHCPGRLILFFDEIDAVRSLPFPADEFFAGIRECYNRRTRDPEYERLVFCLAGVATPSDLIQDTRTTPFNIGRRIELTDFTEAEAAPLAAGLGVGCSELGVWIDPSDPSDPTRHRTPNTQHLLLRRVLYWTGGHPYLTQRLCQAVAESNPNSRLQNPKSEVDRLCAELFLVQGAAERDHNLLFVRARLLRSEADVTSLLELYGKVRAGSRVGADDTNQLVSVLRLSGAVRVICEGVPTKWAMGQVAGGYPAKLGGRSRVGRLVVRNRIYARVFDRAWVRAHMPDAEQRRQQAAFRRGLLRASAVAGVVLVILSALAITAISQAGRARRLTTRLRVALRQKEKTLQDLGQALTAEHTEHARANRTAERAKNVESLEHQEKVQADAARGEAVQARQRAEQQTRIARAEQEVNRRRLVRLNVGNGTSLVEEGDLLGALPWLVEALRLDQGTEAEKRHRVRLAAVLRQCPRPVQILFHSGPVRHVEFSPDGARLVTASADGTARVWKVGTGQPVTPLLKHHAGLWQAAFSLDGRRVVTASQDGTAQVWDANTGRPVGSPARHHGPVRVAAFSPDGRFLVTASDDQTARVWNGATGRPVTPPLRHGAAVVFACFSPDGRRVLTASSDRTARVWDAVTGQPITASLKHSDLVRHAAFSPDGRRIVTASSQEARVWDATTGQPLPLVLPHTHYVSSAAFSPDGRALVTASWDATARVWNAATGDPLTPPLKNRGPVREALFASDGRRVVTVSQEEARVWDATTGLPVSPFLKHAGTVWHAAFSPDGRRLATASEDGTVRVWDLATGHPSTVTLAHSNWVEQAVFSPDGHRVLTASWDDTARVWDAATGRPLTHPLRHDDLVWHAAFSPDGRRVVTASGDHSARVWDTDTGRPLTPPLRHGRGVRWAVFSPDGRRVATASSDETARVWDAATGRPITPPLRHRAAVLTVAFSPDGRSLLSASQDGSARRWDAAAGREKAPPLRHNGAVWWAGFSPDGRRVLTASEDGTARVWDAATSRPITPPLRHPDAVTSAAFSPDGRRVVTAGRDHRARVWDATTGRPLLPPLPHEGEVRTAVFSPDGRRLVTASRGDAARVWDTSTGEPLAPPLWHSYSLIAADFSPTGDRIVTASGDDSAAIWDLAPDERSVPDLRSLAELLSVHSLDASAGIVPLEPRVIRRLWQDLHAKHAAEFTPSLRQVVGWRRDELYACEKAERWPAALAHLNALLAVQPVDPILRARRANAYAAMERWDRAASDLSGAIEQGSVDPAVWYHQALIQLIQGDAAGYRRTCADLLRRFGATRDVGAADVVARTCVLGPDAVLDRSRPVRVIEPMLIYNPRKYLTTLGAALYRAGRLEEAVQRLNEAAALTPSEGPAPHALWLAMCHYRLGHAREERQWLALGMRWIEPALQPAREAGEEARPRAPAEPRSAGSALSWQERLELRLLRREVTPLLARAARLP